MITAAGSCEYEFMPSFIDVLYAPFPGFETRSMWCGLLCSCNTHDRRLYNWTDKLNLDVDFAPRSMCRSPKLYKRKRRGRRQAIRNTTCRVKRETNILIGSACHSFSNAVGLFSTSSRSESATKRRIVLVSYQVVSQIRLLTMCGCDEAGHR